MLWRLTYRPPSEACKATDIVRSADRMLLVGQKEIQRRLYFREHPIVTLMIVLFDCASPESNQGYHGHNVRY